MAPWNSIFYVLYYAIKKAVFNNQHRIHMPNKELDKILILRRVKEMLKTGASKQEAYEQLSVEFQNRQIIAKTISRFPSGNALKKYGIWNTILLALLTITAIFLLLPNPNLGTALWYGLLIIAVARKSTRFYFWISVLTSMGLITILYLILVEPIGNESLSEIAAVIILLIPSCVLPIWLKNKLAPEPDEEREFYENEDGQTRSRINYIFN